MSNPPRARIVTPEAPVNVVKNAQTRVVAIAGPPRSEPNSTWNTRINRCDAWLSARK